MKLEAQAITKKFGEQIALDHVDLSIENGEFFGLLGTNGAGKTTMIRILSTLMLPTSGSVLADGQELTRNNVELKKKITVMTQEYTLRNDMTIEEILEYQGRLYHVPKKERAYVIKFYLTGVFAIVMEWLDENCIDDIDTVIKVITDCVMGDRKVDG